MFCFSLVCIGYFWVVLMDIGVFEDGLLFRGSGEFYLLISFSFTFCYLALTVAIWWRKPVKAFHLIIVYSTLTWLHAVLAVPLVNAMRKCRSHRLIIRVFELQPH